MSEARLNPRKKLVHLPQPWREGEKKTMQLRGRRETARNPGCAIIAVLDRTEQAARKEGGLRQQKPAELRPFIYLWREQTEDEIASWPFARNIIIQIGINGFVFRVDLHRQREQNGIHLQSAQAEFTLQPRPRRAFFQQLQVGVVQQLRTLGKFCGIAYLRCLLSIPQQRVHLCVTHVKSAELIQGELVDGAQTQDFAMQQPIQPLQLALQILSVRIHHSSSFRKNGAWPALEPAKLITTAVQT